MLHSYPSTHGPPRPSSRRRSPTNLDSAEFSVGATQPQGWPYDPRISATTIATNQLYRSATQDGYPYYTQPAESSYYNQTATSSSSYQNYNAYPPNTQPYQQTGASYQSAPTFAGTSSSYYDSSARPSISYASDSIHQHVAASAVSLNTSQPAPNVNPASSETRIKNSKLTTRRPKDSNPDMNSKMGRWRLGKDLPAQPPSQPFAISELKRKDRASPPPETSREAETVTKKAKSAERSRNVRAELSEDIAKLTERLPPRLRHEKDKPSRKNVGYAVVYIDEQNARIGRLETETAQLRTAQVHLESENFALLKQNKVLVRENTDQQRRLNEKDVIIGEYQREWQTWQHLY